MIWSVSMLSDGRPTVRERMWVIGSMGSSVQELAGVGDASTHGGGRGRRGAGEQRARAGALPALEVAGAGAQAVVAGRDGVAVHAGEDRAAGLAPLGAGLDEHARVAEFLGLLLDLLGARH